MTTDAAAPEVLEAPEALAPDQATPEVATPEIPSSPESEPEIAPADSFNFEELPEFKEISATHEPPAAAAPEMPGEPVEQFQSRLEAQRAETVRNFMQASDADWRNYLQTELGFSPQDAHNAWHGKLGPVIRSIFQNNAAYDKVSLESAIDSKLPKESVEVYRSRVYPNKAEAVKAVHDAGVTTERARWEAKVKSGEYFTKSQVKKLAEAAYSRGLGRSEQAGGVDGTAAGQVLSGTPISRKSEDEILLDPKSDIKVVEKILARRNGQ